jgi:hypothetical protein
MRQGTEVSNPTVAVRALRATRMALLALQAAALATVVADILRGGGGSLQALKSAVKALAWPFGKCLWCSGQETGEGIVLILADGLGYLVAICLPLLAYSLLGLLLRRLTGAGDTPPRDREGPRLKGLGTLSSAGALVLLAGAALYASWPTDRAAARRAANVEVPVDAPALAGATPELPPPERTAYAVQVGVFEDAARAAKLRAMLIAAGLNASVTLPVEGRHRVRVGPFERRLDAEAAAKEIRDLALPAAILELHP